jgi:pimeloyl-ACP methyl ester carboxylesterase
MSEVNLNNLKKHGSEPYHIVAVHGGPGAQGDIAILAAELSKNSGILEPYQTYNTIEAQILELKSLIETNANSKVTLIGHSWGAWLCYIFSARYPEMVKKLILIASAPFEVKYVKEAIKLRMSRLNQDEKNELNSVYELLNCTEESLRNIAFEGLGQLMMKIDSYDLMPFNNKSVIYKADIFQQVWSEASELRKKGYLLKIGKKIQCPVIAIHGDYDSHPYKGVQEPLSKIIKNFKFILLEECGHYPWLERKAAAKFYEILFPEIS